MNLKSNSLGIAITSCLIFGLAAFAGSAIGQESQESEDYQTRRARRKEDLRGVFAVLEHADGKIEYAVDPAPRYAPISPPRAKRVTWSGVLTTYEEGQYRFAAEFRGKLLWKMGKQLLVSEMVLEATARASPEIALPAGEHEFSIEFEPMSDQGSLRTFWSGPKFLAEPMPEAALNYGFIYELPELTRAETIGDIYPTWRRGNELFRTSRCAACHELAGEPSVDAASNLAAAGDWLRPEWVVNTLVAHERGLHRSMPTFELDRSEAETIANAICKSNAQETKSTADAASLAKGEELLTTTGCLACHAWKDISAQQNSFGGDLTHIGEKYSGQFFEKWLAAPKAIQPTSKMPKPDLSKAEIDAISMLLRHSRGPLPALAATDDAKMDPKPLIAQHRCNACHQLSDDLAAAPVGAPIKSSIKADWEDSCLGEPTSRHPGYRFSTAETQALKAYITSKLKRTLFSSFSTLDETPLSKHGCVNCHSRGTNGGLRSKLLETVAEEPERFSNLPGMLPPSLESVGDKLLPNALADSVQRTAKTKSLRPWLSVRMPHYVLSKDQLKALLDQLTWEDQVPDSILELLSKAPATTRGDAELKSAGARLVTTDGFSCTSCHDIGKWKASPAKPAARGTDLAECGLRIRESWFYRWLRNPARISPNMEMPSVQVAAKGVLGDDLDLQSRALWKALNERGFTPPSSGALRVLAGNASARQPTAYLMDVVIADGKTYIKPLVIAFPKQVNLLWDMEQNRLARFWVGEAARQYTRGKSWYWQVEGDNLLLATGRAGSEMSLVDGGKRLASQRSGQFQTEIDSLKVDAEAISIGHRVHFTLSDGRQQSVRVTQRFAPFVQRTAAESKSGFSREITFEGLAPAQTMELAIESLISQQLDVQIRRLESQSGGFLYEYLTNTPRTDAIGQPFFVKAEAASSPELVPGFVAHRLPLPIEIMPTAMAWRPDSKLGVASLRGRVWEISDTDGDGVEETAAPFTDELAAPYGLAGAREGYDILAKGGLYRAADQNGDGVAEELRLLASGWGHTDDYHDWAVGLPSDGQGGYYVVIPCQQDDRSAEAAQYRGKMLHLVTRENTLADPRTFEIKVVSSGHRFPMGLARRATDGELFVSDNQGNYNPFNELNHVSAGRFFGFLNQLDKKQKKTVSALTPPAINIPHPWTRSVNGICFLESPAGKSFGPYEGHLIGCEYDTRRLVRMTLQRTGDSFQGAVYPFSREASKDGIGFLGPVSCAISPRGELYVGSMKDSGWGAGNNVGEVFQLKFKADSLPAGIREVTATGEGQLTIELHGAIDPAAARDARNYRIESYTRISTPAYGGDDQQRKRETIEQIEFDEKSGRAQVTLDKLRSGFVYEIHLDQKIALGEDFFPTEAHFTYHRAP
jgi:glucose/arabinose dehydrogenase/mono/diheme cytochrome c family protein/cytochrome c551/c552